MRDLRAQYFLSYGMLGTVMPYVSVFFRGAGLSQTQVGYAYAIWSVAFVLSPVVMTWVADTHADPRRLMRLALAVSGLALLALGIVRGVGPILAVWAVHCLAAVPVMPLQDGICLGIHRRQLERGEPAVPYHRVRVWGTVGFIVPSVLLFWLLYKNYMPVGGARMSGAAFAGMAAVQSLFLLDPRVANDEALAIGLGGPVAHAARPKLRMPTLTAARALLRPSLFVFCMATVLGQMASTMFGAFYPIYLTESVGVPAAWVGLIANVGVVVEIFFVAGCGWMVGRLGVKWFMALGMACTAARMGLLFASTAIVVAVGTQLFHGMLVTTLGVVPQTFLDRHADDRWRNSMQGVFTMLMGCGRIAASLTAGLVAAHGVRGVFAYGAMLCTAAAVLVVATFFDTHHDDASGGRGFPVVLRRGRAVGATPASPCLGVSRSAARRAGL